MAEGSPEGEFRAKIEHKTPLADKARGSTSTEVKSGGIPAASETPAFGRPIDLEAKQRLVDLGSGGRAKESQQQGLFKMREEFKKAFEAGETGKANRIKQNIEHIERNIAARTS